MKKAAICLFVLMGFIACATVHNTSAQPSNVSFLFKNGDTAVLTFWRKLNDDGSASGPFSVGVSNIKLIFNMPFPKAYAFQVKLDPGYYYLDSFQIDLGNSIFVSEKAFYANRNGWDKANNKPKYVAFKVIKGEDLVLPEVTINLLPNADKSKYTAAFVYSDPKNIFIRGTMLKNK